MERRFLAVLAISPHELIERRRLTHAQEALANSDRSATAIAETMGFSSIHAFSRWFSRLTGKSPARYRNSAGSL